MVARCGRVAVSPARIEGEEVPVLRVSQLLALSEVRDSYLACLILAIRLEGERGGAGGSSASNQPTYHFPSDEIK